MSFGARSTISPGRKSQVFSGAIFGLREPFHSGGASPWKSYSIQPQWILSPGGQSYHLACYELQSRSRDEQGHWWGTPTDTNKLENSKMAPSSISKVVWDCKNGSCISPWGVPEEVPASSAYAWRLVGVYPSAMFSTLFNLAFLHWFSGIVSMGASFLL